MFLGTGVCADHQPPGPFLSGPSPPNSQLLSRPWSVGLRSSVCVSPRLSWLPRGPASVAGNLQRSKAWIPPALGLRTHPPLPTFQSLLPSCPALSFCHSQSSRRSGRGWSRLPKGSWGTASAQEPLQGVVGDGPCSPLFPLASAQDRGDLKVLLRLLLSCGHRGPHTLREEAFPPFASSRPPPVPRSPALSSKPLPQMQMSVCACLWGHMRRARVWLCVQP